MMCPFMTMNDETEIVHSDMQDDGRVKVYIEKPDEQYWCQNINSASQNEKIPNRQYMIQQKYRTEGGSHYGKAT